HKKQVYDVAFIHGTRLLVSGSFDKRVRVWALDTGKQVGKSLLGHDDAVLTVAASPDGRWIVSGGENGRILVWKVATDKTDLRRIPVSFLKYMGGIKGVVFAPDSETYASASGDKTVCVWKRETGKIVLGPLKVGSGAYSVSYSPDGKKLAAGTEEHIITTRFFDLTTFEPIGEPLEHPDTVLGLAFSEDSQLIATGCADNLVRTW
ncbi:WD40 repeat-like protein, partial [Suillus weaverae]